ncbi:MAG: hypothetical protein GVY36_14070 [Verrucomicrobia bacterium]|jgi:hypothetical protein|nr:hypothetical protein [Verrucomicrobiota bacterium]
MLRQHTCLLLSLCLLGLFVGCQKDEDLENLRVPRLMIEARGVNYGSLTGTTAVLPLSGTQIPLQSEPLVSEFEIANVELVKVDMGMALLIQLTERGARDLYRGSVSNNGGRVVLTVNGNPIGARRLGGAIEDGNFYTFVEVDDEELGQLVLDIKETLQAIQKKL